MSDSPLPLRCPVCGGSLPHDPHSAALRCPACGASYPQTLGIPDLRYPPPAPNPEEEAVAARLLEDYETLAYPDLVALRLRLEPGSQGASEALMAHITEYVLTQPERGRRMVSMYLQELERRFSPPGGGLALDLGCGSGASLFALAETFEHVAGVEPSLASLLLARKALESRGVENVTLVQGYGQHLPFPDDVFQYANALNVLEHVFEVEAVLEEVHRALSPGGYFAADSRNRYDLFLPEPHVQIRWVGLLPRRWAAPYVRRRTGLRYDHTLLLSYGNLQKALRKAFGEKFHITFAYPSAYGSSQRADGWVRALGNIPLLGRLALQVYPSHLAVAQK